MKWYDSVLSTLPDLIDNAANPIEWEKRRAKILDVLFREEYGYPADVKLDGGQIKSEGKGDGYLYYVVELALRAPYGRHTYELYIAVPDNVEESEKLPAFVYIGFSAADTELVKKITGEGFALCGFAYESVTSDTADFNDGLAGVVYGGGARFDDGCGKIMLWAQAAVAVVEYISSIEYIDQENIAVIGHSRLGKTALVAGAISDKFNYVISNNSGCSGAAITRSKRGEHVDHITSAFSYWFCKNYAEYSGREYALPFDQHWLIAMTAPRHVIVGSASEDIWADPVAEYLGCKSATPAWELHGLSGVEELEHEPKIGDILHIGNIGYHLRAGEHNLKLEDWDIYMRYIKEHI